MDTHLLDDPVLLSILFYPRPAQPSWDAQPARTVPPHIHDGLIPEGDGVELGYRLYVHKADAPVILYFHGNGEIASDCDELAPEYHRAGASLLVVDYRGYGWSTGRPRLSTLLPDAEEVLKAMPDVLKKGEISTDAELYVMGRSLGSACAIHAAYTAPERFTGLILESAFADVIPLLIRLGFPAQMLAQVSGDGPDPINNVGKMKAIHLPLLVIHGEQDNLIPFSNGQKLYETSPAALKYLVRISGAGHNDLLLYGLDRYFGAVSQLIRETSHREKLE